MSGPDERPAPRPRPEFKPRIARPDNDAIRALATAAAEGTRFDRPAPGQAGPGAGSGPGAGQGGQPVPAGLPPAIAAPRGPEPSKKATFDFPASLHKALQHAAVEQGVTMRHIIMQSLSDAGYPVPADALIPDRRTVRGSQG